MAISSMHLGMRKEGVVGHVEKTSQWEVTCSVWEKEQQRGKCEKAFDAIASHGMDDFLDSYRGWLTTVRRIRALDMTHNQHNVSQSLPGS